MVDTIHITSYDYVGIYNYCSTRYSNEEHRSLSEMSILDDPPVGVCCEIAIAIHLAWHPEGNAVLVTQHLVDSLKKYRDNAYRYQNLLDIEYALHIDKFMYLMYYAPLEVMPLYVCHTSTTPEQQLSLVARWRLSLGR